MTDESNSSLVLSVPLHSAELAKLRFLKLIMNARLPLWPLGIVKIHLSLLDPLGQIVLNRDRIKQNSSAEMCLSYKMSWTSPAAAGEK